MEVKSAIEEVLKRITREPVSYYKIGYHSKNSKSLNIFSYYSKNVQIQKHLVVDTSLLSSRLRVQSVLQ